MPAESKETYWSKYADTFDEQQEHVAGKELLNEIQEELSHLSDLGDLLELGCGTGKFTETIAQKATTVVATDLSDELLKKADLRLSHHPKICLQKEDCMNLSFSASQFDSVFMANLIHVIENPRKLIQESHRILKTDGKLIVVSFTSFGMKILAKIRLGLKFLKTWGKPPRHTHNFSPKTLSSLLETEGFEVLEAALLGTRTRALYLIAKKKP